ncbi:MAG: hypothetical protein U1D97_10380, partial [Desulfuromonadales bacterium]|nr:hypothetical protein [Desulfuromonadales bacterium]
RCLWYNRIAGDTFPMKTSPRASTRLLIPLLVGLLFLNIGLLIALGVPLIRQRGWSLFSATPTAANPPASDSDPAPIPAVNSPQLELPPYIPPPQTTSVEEGLQRDGLIILSLRDGNYNHLFAYHPLYLPLTRITNNPWDDIAPTVNPEGTQVAFSSRRNGYWNLYILDLNTGNLKQITDTPEYVGEPSWSPDGTWLVYEGYSGSNLDIFVLSTADPAQTPIRLTESSGIDGSPVWSPRGREVAFVSTRSGEPEIWLARLDEVDNRFVNLSQNADSRESHPAWSPDGRYLAWASESGGVSSLMVRDQQKPEATPHLIGSGSRPIWNPQGNVLLAEIRFPNHTALTAYTLSDRQPLYALIRLPGSLMGVDWKGGRFPALYRALPRISNAAEPSPPLWSAVLTANPHPPSGRFGIVPLFDVTAPYAYLHDAVDEAFNNLRRQTGSELGWDLLSSLESAYFPLTDPPPPGMEANWLMTGRAIALNPATLNAGWMVMVREEYGGQTYWRLYAKTRFQDGSQGAPLQLQPWDISARYAGNPQAYEQGGRLASVPDGYWVDFTELAQRYGWVRLPALVNWRTYFQAARFNQFVLNEGLDWNAALQEIYPPEALATATPIPSRTPTPAWTPTPGAGQRHTPTPTPTIIPAEAGITLTPTLHPTWTPLP